MLKKNTSHGIILKSASFDATESCTVKNKKVLYNYCGPDGACSGDTGEENQYVVPVIVLK